MNSESYIIVIAISAFLCLALGIILFVFLYQRRVINHQLQIREFNRQKELELMQAIIRSDEEQRMRIATDLHDDVGAILSSVRLFLHRALNAPEDPKLTIQTKELLDESIQKVRDISHQLQPSTLEYLGLTKSLQSLAGIITRSGAVIMQVTSESELWADLGAQTELSIYRIIQELVNNTIKHAKAAWIRISIGIDENMHCINLQHDGQGLTQNDYHEKIFKADAIGLKNIEHRLKSANISIKFIVQEDISIVKLYLP